MKADVVGPGVGKGSGHGVYGLHHQVHVHGYRRAVGLFGMRFDSLANHRAEGEVGHVMVVHHVKVHPVGPSGNDIFDLVAQAGKVGGQDGGGNVEGSAHSLYFRIAAWFCNR